MGCSRVRNRMSFDGVILQRSRSLDLAVDLTFIRVRDRLSLSEVFLELVHCERRVRFAARSVVRDIREPHGILLNRENEKRNTASKTPNLEPEWIRFSAWNTAAIYAVP